MKLSFGMIFSIILIIVFLVVAFYAIQKFVLFQKEITYKQFVEDFQSDVDKMWKSTQGSQILTYAVPSSIVSVCFRDDPLYVMKINYKNKFSEEKLNHLDINKILAGRTEMCVEAKESKIKMVIQKNYSEPLVIIKPVE